MTTALGTPQNRISVEQRHLIELALARGVREALARHRERGLPIVVEQDGQIVWVPADKIP
jgi:hypothetical protein